MSKLKTDEARTILALTPPEAARALGIGTRLLWSWTNQGDVPHVRMGRRILYPVDQLRTWLAERAGKVGQG